MKHLTKWLAVLLCVSLAACGAANTESDTAGSDWRTTGIVRDSGELTQNGEMQTVLLCVHENDAVLYKDSEVQTAVCSVEYPMAVPTRGTLIKVWIFPTVTATETATSV